MSLGRGPRNRAQTEAALKARTLSQVDTLKGLKKKSSKMDQGPRSRRSICVHLRHLRIKDVTNEARFQR